MFLGEFDHSVDYKGRVSVPKKFRPKLEAGVLTRGLDGCLFLYTQESWVQLTEKLATLPLTQREGRAFSRYFLSGATEVKFDSLGRITIPEFLKDYAHINQDVSFVGVGERLEIWDKETWKKYRGQTEKDSEDIADKLIGSGV